MMKNLATVISYYSNDERFIRECIKNALAVSDHVVVPVSSHFYDGTSEDLDSVRNLAKEFPEVEFILFEWSAGRHPRYWNNMSRIIGHSQLPEEIEWVLFLDADEIIDKDLFLQFKNSPESTTYDTQKLACYWYFREPTYRATSIEDSPVLVRKELVNINPNNPGLEREQMHELLQGVTKKRVVLQNNTPMLHHFSWVRTKEQMLQKVKAWSHTSDRGDWADLVEEEFSRPFNGRSFVNDYNFVEVDNIFNV